MLWGRLGVTLALQSLGALASVASTLIVAHRFGPSGQGFISLFRSIVEFLTFLAMLGLPQALLFMINSAQISARHAVNFSFCHAAATAIVYAAACAIVVAAGLPNAYGVTTVETACACAAAILLVLHGLLRAISLTGRSVLPYNFLNVAPPILILVFYAIWSSDNYRSLSFAWVLMALLATTLAAILVWRNTAERDHERPSDSSHADGYGAPIRTALQLGTWSFIAEVTSSAVVLLTYASLRQATQSEEAIGHLSIAWFVLSSVLLPINMIVPVLFDSWSKAASREKGVILLESVATFAHLGTALSLGVACIGYFFVAPAIDIALGPRFDASILPSRVLLVAFYLFCQTRLLMIVHYTLGRHRSAAFAGMLRIAVVIIALPMGFLDTPVSAALAWIAGEAVAYGFLLNSAYRLLGWPAALTGGFSARWTYKKLHWLRNRGQPHVVNPN